MKFINAQSIKVEKIIVDEKRRFEEKDNIILETGQKIAKMKQENQYLELEIEKEKTKYNGNNDNLVKSVQALMLENGFLLKDKENATKKTPARVQVR